MPFFYQSEEQIKPGDRVTYHGEPGEIEFVADKLASDNPLDWHVEEQGEGVMIIAKNFGRVFVHDTEDEEDLIPITRKESTEEPQNSETSH